MKNNPLQNLFAQIRVSFLGDDLMGKYANEKAPLRSELFSTEQMEQYARSLAGRHVLTTGKRPEQLLKRLADNEEVLLEVHGLLTESAKKGSRISPAGEWLLDNFYLIEEHIHTGKKHLPKGYSEGLPRLAKGISKDLPRVYDIALEIISHSDGRVDLRILYSFITAYMSVSDLNLGELWAIPIMLRLALIENLRRLSAQLALDMINHNLADYWADQMTETAEKDPKNLIVVIADMARSEPPMVSSFVAELTRRLLGKGPALNLPLTWIEQRLSENGQTSNGLVHIENQNQASAQVSMSNSISSLRFLNNTDWREFVEKTSLVEEALREDISGLYPKMDFHTRDQYRHVVEQIAKHSKKSEQEVARIALELSKEHGSNGMADSHKSHVGYFLMHKGLRQTERLANMQLPGWKKMGKALGRAPLLLYAGSITLISLGLGAALFAKAYWEPLKTGWWIAAGVVSVLAVSQFAVSVVNWISTLLVKPDFIPRLDFSAGIFPEYRTLVVVPTLLDTPAELESLIETMEVRYLANKDEFLHFAFLTDFRDANFETLPEDEALLQVARQRISELNHKYGRARNDIFFLFHRPRKWNPADKVWMGYERKRGKLGEMNALLRGKGKENFLLIVGEKSIFPEIRYVITLDTDTELPRDAARKIAAAMAHPLNHPVYDEKKKRVTDGYTILQPRIVTSLPGANSSLYAKLHGNEPGIDPYTRAVSDVYQDLFQEGSFIGKGIYDVDAFEKTLSNRFPENRILSHDLLEGSYARSGLITDVQFYEGYPSTYQSDMKRRHRWIRGDWQIGRWLFPRVPGPARKTLRNPLTTLSRWKIFDNLRRSLVPAALLSLLLFGWLLSPAPWFWMIMVFAIYLLPAVAIFIGDILRKPKDVLLVHHTTNVVQSTTSSFLNQLFIIACLPHEAIMNLHAILLTLWRMFISHRRLLQWDPGHQHNGTSATLVKSYFRMWPGPIISALLFGYLTVYSPLTLALALPILIVWALSPAIAWVISLPQRKAKPSISKDETIYLRKLARKTWGYFENFVCQEDNWLPPDNYQETPVKRVAHRTSPTNMGMSLLANLTACDFGFISIGHLLERTSNTLATMQQMERFRDHFYNWYDTRSLVPLHPRYISTVDSGNLAGHLLTMKQGLLELKNEKITGPRLLEGLQTTASILADKMGKQETLDAYLDEIETAYDSNEFSLVATMDCLEKLLELSVTIQNNLPPDPENEINWWAKSLSQQTKNAFDELMTFVPWLFLPAAPEHLRELTIAFMDIPTLGELSRIEKNLVPVINEYYTKENSKDDIEWLDNFRKYITEAGRRAKERMLIIDRLAMQCNGFSNMEFDFLFDKTKNLLSIGYNVDEHRKDTSYYDLLGSEARLAVFVGIAQGKIPQESWFALGRQLTNPGTSPVLLSWSGSMFEYLMPLLVMPTYENTLLDQTNKLCVQRQIDYGNKHNMPWGISESGYNLVDAQLNYQYRAFGVPGLGLKRGLGEDLVIAPYATVMALMVSPEEATDNLKKLAEKGYEGKFGFFEAVDYTPARLPRGQAYVVIRSFMAHHEGMSLLSLAYLLLDQPMQRRFSAEIQFQATLLLLQERIPSVATFYTPTVDTADISVSHDDMQMRIINTANTQVPEIQLLSNGNYHVMVSNSGGGYSRWKEFSLTRWREDSTCDNWGNFCYIRDLETNLFWSTGHQPSLKQAEGYEVIFSQGRAEFRRRDNNIETHSEIVVSPEDDVEMRRVHLTNRSRKKRVLEITSYAEVVLAPSMADAMHPAFSNLFVQTEIIEQRQAILCTRRPRSFDEKPPWMFHLMKVHDTDIDNISYETSRDQFIGRGNSISDPKSMRSLDPLSNSQGSVLDPIVSIRYKITLLPQESVTIDMIYGIGPTKEVCDGLIEKYQDRHMIDRAFELAWTHSQVVLRQINATESDAQLYGRLASSVIYANASLRADPGIIYKNNRGQSGLWSFSVSGDLPIVLLQIEDNANLSLVKQLVQAHAYWRLKGLLVDLVIWNEDHGSYRQTLQNELLALISPGIVTNMQDRPGSIFIRSADQISNEDRILFQTVARVVIADRLGTLEGQISRRSRLKTTAPTFTPSKFYPSVETSLPPVNDLQYFNGLGGFSTDGKEYIITTTPGKVTAAPWSNVLANPRFGSIISESGQSYTWLENAHEYRLTPWNNDPVTDSAGETYYIRDEESGRYWSPTPLPARGKSPYRTRHGFGYSIFEHSEDGIVSELTVFVDLKATIKFMVLKVRNVSGRVRRLSATGYIEWVLGDLRSKSGMHVITELDITHGAIFARNSYSAEFPSRIAFFDVDDASKTITTDRGEFIGRNGTLRNPDAMTRERLSGKTGAALDACAVIQVAFTLAESEDREIIFRLGAGLDMQEASNLVRQYRGHAAAYESLDKVKKFWQRTLNTIQVSTPENSLNLITNGWLNYQTLACRLWGRSGYYQSGGAFGFRDQLQDVLSLMHADPSLVRQQILLSASRQFKEGDVQHWWHPPAGRGVRTRCSDDYLWLPFVTCRYVLSTGDTEILEEVVSFLEGRLLYNDEESYYDLPLRSETVANLYTHCIRAIEHGLQFGEHGLPFMGSGDWNDGMDKVGIHGRGESVWLAFFLYEILVDFVEIANLKNDKAFAEKCGLEAQQLKRNIAKNAWDGEWYKRAYFDDGTPLGSSVNTECTIDSIVQSWSVLSGGGDPERSRKGMDEAYKRLVRKEHSLIQLFDPPFDKSDLNPGYIKGYVPGVRENGGQYTHAAIWMIMAFAGLKRKDRTWELIQMINPVNLGSTPEKISRYKVEPYVIAADVYAIAEQSGRGGWTWYTGSAGWMYQLIISYVFGLRRRNGTLVLNPCLPSEWNSIQIRYRFEDTYYQITVIQEEPDGERIMVELDGQMQKHASIALVNDHQEHEVRVRLTKAEIGEELISNK